MAGENVTIEGENFEHGCDVLFGTVSCKNQILYDGVPTRLVVQVPVRGAEDSRTVIVQVINPDVPTATANSPHDRFTYRVSDNVHLLSASVVGGAKVTGLIPSVGETAVSTPVQINGDDLPVNPIVYFGTKQAQNPQYYAATEAKPAYITVNSPVPQTGLVEVTVKDNSTNRPVSNQPWNMFTFANLPSVLGVSPTSGPTAGNTQVTITGTGFTGALEVLFGATSATFQIQNDTTIIARSPAESAGLVDVRVRNSVGTSPINRPADQFRYVPPGSSSGQPSASL